MKCEICEFDNYLGATLCKRCGNDLLVNAGARTDDASLQPPTPISIPTVEASPPDATVTCPHCAFVNRLGANVCSECGRPLSSAEQLPGADGFVCPNPACRFTNLPDAVYCSECGWVLSVEKGPATSHRLPEGHSALRSDLTELLVGTRLFVVRQVADFHLFTRTHLRAVLGVRATGLLLAGIA